MKIEDHHHLCCSSLGLGFEVLRWKIRVFTCSVVKGYFGVKDEFISTHSYQFVFNLVLFKKGFEKFLSCGGLQAKKTRFCKECYSNPFPYMQEKQCL